MQAQNMNEAQRKQAGDATLQLAHQISILLDTGLDKETVGILVALCENGVNPENQPLIGSAGQAFVQQALASGGPARALKQIQQRGGLHNPRCAALLGMLDHLRVTRLEAHRHVLEGATAVLLKRVQGMGPDALLKLLAETFPYIGLAELRAVPMAILERLDQVPEEYLQTLADTKDLFRDLSANVQRQVHELDRRVLQQHAAPLMVNYIYKSAVVLGSLNLDEFRQPLQGSLLAGRHGPGRARLRNTNDSLQRLVNLMAGSAKIYHGIIDLTVAKFRDSDSAHIGIKDTGYCTLRSQLLMACHDKAALRRLAMEDPCHQLAWTLDSAIMQCHTALDAAAKRMAAVNADPGAGKAAANSNKQQQQQPADEVDLSEWPVLLDPFGIRAEHLKVLRKFFEDARVQAFDEEQEQARGKKGKKKKGQAGAASSLGVHSGSTGPAEPGKTIGEAGMVVRDPSALHLLAFQVTRRLKHAAEKKRHAFEDPDLVFMIQLLQLASDCRQMLRDKEYRLPEPPEAVVRDLLPRIATLMLNESDLEPGCPVEDDDDALMHADTAIVAALRRHEAGRWVAQCYTIERVAARDWPTALQLLACIGQVFAKADGRSLFGWAAFTSSLARHLAQLLSSGQVQLDDPVWRTCMDRILLKGVDIDSQVHEDVLRVLVAGAERRVHAKADMAAAGAAVSDDDFPLPRLIDYLHACIDNSRHSRRRHAKRLRDEAAFIEAEDEGAAAGYASTGRAFSSRAAEATDGGNLTSRWDNTDGVKPLYSRFLPDIREVNATFERRGNERLPRVRYRSLGMQLGINPQNAPKLVAYMTDGDLSQWEEMTGLDQYGNKLARQARREEEHARKLAEQEMQEQEGEDGRAAMEQDSQDPWAASPPQAAMSQEAGPDADEPAEAQQMPTVPPEAAGGPHGMHAAAGQSPADQDVTMQDASASSAEAAAAQQTEQPDVLDTG